MAGHREIVLREISPEVLVADVPLLTLTSDHIEHLKVRASKNPRRRIRLCAHRNLNDAVHEMLIVMTQECYIRPHKHLGKGESFHIVEGALDVVGFDEVGNVTTVLPLGDYGSGQSFYYRSDELGYHTVIIRSAFVVIHETTRGPFRAADNIVAPWSPDEKDPVAVGEFLARLGRMIEKQTDGASGIPA
ncbi:MAG: cupin fold metalloprotein, WbuC family [Nitrospira sp.]|nr:cupin fold metalloprotein, WbuC family [Nitrospira sp.]